MTAITGVGVALARIATTSLTVVAIAACNADVASPADPRNATQVAAGRTIYAAHCASCHGRDLEGQPGWRARLPTGRMPAPPHDASGHTWHHPDDVLFGITKFGVGPPYGPPGYQSDMPAFGSTLADADIWNVIAYIKSRWSQRELDAQAEIDRRRRAQ